jgi:hypothetical protein
MPAELGRRTSLDQISRSVPHYLANVQSTGTGSADAQLDEVNLVAREDPVRRPQNESALI